MSSTRSGFSLIELVLAIIILGGGLAVIYQSIMMNMRVIGTSRSRQDVAYVFSLGEIAYPLRDIEDPEEDIPVDPDGTLKEGYIYERTVDEKEEPEDGVVDDRLYTIRTIVSWENGANREEIVSYYRHTESTTTTGKGSQTTSSSSK
ncbi:MAG: prepilin-type N-terminal cleavage/methylation domain-containing protein [bacterium]|nr:prepilin-type N-terminal cleavage/methylation domain-containing protein [bacterium]MDO5461994.1 prepilin-type N-terminal cleavage/methylation domain-containing protein [bacterium]